jgi:hypothetical protein
VKSVFLFIQAYSFFADKEKKKTQREIQAAIEKESLLNKHEKGF